MIDKIIQLPVTIIRGNYAPWLTVLLTQLGVKETPGSGSNPLILHFHSFTTLKAKSDEIAWCSSALCWALETAGYKSTRSAAARSWLTFGKTVTIDRLQKGDILLFKTNIGSGYHVAIAASDPKKNGTIDVVGGNQNNQVSIVTRSMKDVAAARRPFEVLQSTKPQ